MPASFPNAVKTFTSRSAGQTIAASHINDLQDEVNAIESGYLNGTAPITASNATVNRITVSSLCAVSSLSVAAGASMSSLLVTGNIDVAGNSTFQSNLTVGGSLGVNTGANFNGQVQFNGIQTSTMGGGNFDDFVVASTVFHLRITCSTASTLSGISGGGGVRRMLLLTNVGTAQLTLLHASGSLSSNQFAFANGANSTVGSGGSMFLIYDATGWRGIR